MYNTLWITFLVSFVLIMPALVRVENQVSVYVSCLEGLVQHPHDHL